MRRVPRVVVTGSESAGKTTLAAALAEALHTTWVHEYSRTYAEQVQRELTAADVEPIARGQVAAEDSCTATWLEEHPGDVRWPPLVLDTDLLSTTVYAEYYYGACPAWIFAAARARLGDLYLLCEPDLPWEPDGVRDQPTHRDVIHAAFERRLFEFDASFERVRGSGAERLTCALEIVHSHRNEL